MLSRICPHCGYRVLSGRIIHCINRNLARDFVSHTECLDMAKISIAEMGIQVIDIDGYNLATIKYDGDVLRDAMLRARSGVDVFHILGISGNKFRRIQSIVKADIKKHGLKYEGTVGRSGVQGSRGDFARHKPYSGNIPNRGIGDSSSKEQGSIG